MFEIKFLSPYEQTARSEAFKRLLGEAHFTMLRISYPPIARLSVNCATCCNYDFCFYYLFHFFFLTSKPDHMRQLNETQEVTAKYIKQCYSKQTGFLLLLLSRHYTSRATKINKFPFQWRRFEKHTKQGMFERHLMVNKQKVSLFPKTERLALDCCLCCIAHWSPMVMVKRERKLIHRFLFCNYTN